MIPTTETKRISPKRGNIIESAVLISGETKFGWTTGSLVVERTLNVLVFSETKNDLINDLKKYSYEIENTENRCLFLGLVDPLT